MGRAGRLPLRPEDFKASQARLAEKSAQLDAYVNRQRDAGRQQRGGHAWLVTQQQLEQEAADSQGELSALVSALPHLPALLLEAGGGGAGPGPEGRPGRGSGGAGPAAGRPSEIGEVEVELPAGLVQGAVSLSLQVAQLLEEARRRKTPLQAATVAEIEGGIAALRQELGAASDLLGRLGAGLGAEARAHAAAAAGAGGRRASADLGAVWGSAEASPGAEGHRESSGCAGGPLAGAVARLCGAEPLADAGVKAQLAELAQQAESAYLAQRAQRAAAYSAFLRSTTSSSNSSGCAAESCVEGCGGPVGSGGSSCLALAGGIDGDTDGAEGFTAGDGQGEPELEAIVEEGSGGLDGGLSSGDGSGSSCFAGGPAGVLQLGGCAWGEVERAAFARIHQDCLAECGPAASQAEVLERMQGRLPHRTVPQLREYWGWHREAARLRNDVIQLQRGWEAEARSFLAAAKALLGESSEEALLRAEAAAARAERELAAAQSAQALGAQQAGRAAEEAQRAQQRLEELAQQAALREAQRAQQERQRARMAHLLAAHRAAQRAKQAKAQAQREAEEARRQQEAAAVAAANQERVDFRRQVAPAAECDPQRAMAPTAASKAAPRRQGAGAAFRALFGFTTDDVVKDQRFKLFEALRQLNLHSFEYAREVVARARPARPSRPDNLTSLQQLGLG